MLKLTPPSQVQKHTGQVKIGLAVAGGGPLGAIYELGALHALEEAIDGLRMHALDVYVGVSSGSILTASLANQITTAQMSRIFMSSPDAEFTFHPELFLKPAFKEYLSRAKALPSVLFDLLQQSIRHPARMMHLEGLEGLAKLIPTGIFDNNSIDNLVAQVLSHSGRTNSFTALNTSLRVVAVDLETGQAVRFGEPGFDDVPISKAVQASSALPGLYPPVEIKGRFFVDGALRRTLHASVALRQGVDFLIAINPLVPFDAHLDNKEKNQVGAKRMLKGGLPLVLSQTFRSLIQSRMQIGMTKYQADFPGAGLLLVEPNRNDERMFFTNVFSYASRNELIERAYQTTRLELLQSADALEALLEPYRLGLNRKALQKTQTFEESLKKEAAHKTNLGRQLAKSLSDLEAMLNT